MSFSPARIKPLQPASQPASRRRESLSHLRRSTSRVWEVDFLRGFGVVLMVFYHLGYYLNYFSGVIALPSFFWKTGAEVIGGIFLTLVGVCLRLRPQRVIWRSARILSVALVLSISVHFYGGIGELYFGILHCIAITGVLALVFKRFRSANIALGLLLILGGMALEEFRLPLPWFILLGTSAPSGMNMVDYYAWPHSLGYVLLGLEWGRRGVQLPWVSPQRWIEQLGRHSLKIYVIHPPIIFGALKLLGLI